MEMKTIKFKAQDHVLVNTNGVQCFPSNTVRYLRIEVEPDTTWLSFDAVDAIFENDAKRVPMAMLNDEGVLSCNVPDDMAARASSVLVNLVGRNMSGNTLVERLTTYQAHAFNIDANANVAGRAETKVTASMYDQFIGNVETKVKKIEDLTVSAHESDTPEVIKTGVVGGPYNLDFGLVRGPQGIQGIQGIQGPTGSDGISPVVEVTETEGGHTVTITDADGEHSFDVLDGVDGEKGEKGDPGEVTQAEFDEAVTDLRSAINETNSKIDQHITVNSSIGAMVDTAEGYFKQAYDAGTHLVYDSEHGLFAPQTTSDEAGEEGYPAIVCSQFSQALMKGIKYSQSRYAKSANHIAGWGYTTDGTGAYVYSSEEMSDLPSQDYMIAKQQCKYAIDHGWIYTITDIRKQVRAGDFIFYGLANVSSWEDITHVALVLHVGLDDNNMINIESDDLTFGSKRVGVGIKRFAIEKKGGHYLFGARFPVEPSMTTPKLILSDKNLSGTNPAYMIKQYTLDEEQGSGFYTAVIDGAFESTRIEIGLHYSDTAANTFDYSRGRMVSNAGRYAVTFYADREFDQVRIGSTANKAYTINKFCLFKGYYGQDWELPI